MSETNRQVVLDFMESWEDHDTLVAGYAKYFADDCTWMNTGMKTVTGKENVLALLHRTIDTWGPYYMATRKGAVVAEGDTVLVERTDVMFTAEGEQFLECPIAGIFEVKDGLITSWRDYYDPKIMFDSAKAFSARKKAEAETAAAQ